MSLTKVTTNMVENPNDFEITSTGSSTARRLSDRFSDVVNVKDFGAVGDGITDDSSAIQIALDAAEGGTIVFPEGRGYRLSSNIYVGNVHISMGDSYFLCDSASFTSSGTALRKNEGIILSKSSEGAGYGMNTIGFSADNLNIHFSRPTESGAKTAFLMENVHSMAIVKYKATTEDQDTAKNVFDLYSGVQNVWIGLMDVVVKNVTKPEALWIRNNNPLRKTCNITIDRLTCEYEGEDEALAIFNFMDNGGELQNISIKDAVFNCTGPSNGVSVLDNDLTGIGVQNVLFDSLNITLNSNGVDTFGFKASDADVGIGNLSVHAESLYDVTGTAFLVRQVKRGVVDNTISVKSAKLIASSSPTTGLLNGINGNVRVDSVNITSEGTAEFNNVVSGGAEIKSGLIDADYTNMAVRTSPFVEATVRGKMEGVLVFKGKHIINTEAHSDNTIWFVHSSVTEGEYPSSGVLVYDAEVEISGSPKNVRVINAAITTGNDGDIYLDVKQRIRNTEGSTLLPDLRSGRCKLTDYDSVVWDGTSSSRRTLTLDI